MDSPSEVSDVFSLSDHLLAERLHFVKEVRPLIWPSLLLTLHPFRSGLEIGAVYGSAAQSLPLAKSRT